MKIQNLLGLMLIGITLTSILLPAFSADQLLTTDFQQESFQKTIDFFEYARAFATANGIPENIPQSWHANLYMTYVNTSGLHMLYAGLINITFGLNAYFTIPMQTFMMHYKTENQTRDVLMASTFLMLLAFNETSDSIHQNSPDMNDTLWASFSMGFDLSQLGATLPILNSKTETIPLTSTTDKLQWTWGMKYTNLTAYWWQTWINPNDPHYQQNWPTAITVYDELTFTYNLTINPTTKTATLTENHIIGKMNHLLLFTAPFWLYLNNTGTYLLGNLVPNSPTIYQFLQENQIKMSIVNFQTSVLLDHTTYSQTTTGENVTDNEKIVSDSQISTYADDGEKIFDVAFGTKQTYKLYNYTADPTETQYDTYDSTTRTAKINSFANNTGLFTYHIGLMKFLPFVTYNMNPQLYNKAKDTITNMTKANYFYLTAYPTYSGYKIEHDPTFTIYLTPSAATAATPPNWIGIIILTAIIITTTATAIVIVRRRKHAQLTQTTQPPTKTA